MHSCISGGKLPKSPASAASPNAAIPLANASADVKDLERFRPAVNDCGRILLPLPLVKEDGGDFFFSGIIACCGCSLKCTRGPDWNSRFIIKPYFSIKKSIVFMHDFLTNFIDWNSRFIVLFPNWKFLELPLRKPYTIFVYSQLVRKYHLWVLEFVSCGVSPRTKAYFLPGQALRVPTPEDLFSATEKAVSVAKLLVIISINVRIYALRRRIRLKYIGWSIPM